MHLFICPGADGTALPQSKKCYELLQCVLCLLKAPKRLMHQSVVQLPSISYWKLLLATGFVREDRANVMKRHITLLVEPRVAH